jgi:transposase
VPALRLQVLVRGDYFILDNASVHNAVETQDLLDNALSNAGVRLIFLPTYSPELNPAELVFAMVKNHIRQHRADVCLLAEIVKGFARVSRENVFRFYQTCINDSL